MIKSLLFTIFLIVSLSACSILATGGAEVSGLSLLHDRRTSDVILKDERIELSSTIKLNSEEDIRNQCHFNVTSYNGRVLVTGEVPTEPLRNKIITLVRRIKGVKLVFNELAIAPLSSLKTRSYDTIITTRVKAALSKVKNLPGFDATRVKVITESGIVYLLGLVHKNEGHVATEITRRETGVKKVIKIFEFIE